MTHAGNNGPRSQDAARPSVLPDRSVPKGVWALSFVEMWERYSFYGLQGILTFYLIYELSQGGLGLTASQGAGVVGGYGAAVYLCQLLGAWAGDRLLAPGRIVLIGAILITAGHVLLAVLPGLEGIGYGLVLIALGTGALKTNITAMIGILYHSRPDDERDAGFAYFYMGINLGAVLGPLTTGFAQNQWGFHYGFTLAAVVMFVSLAQYLVCMRRLPEQTFVLTNPLHRSERLRVGGVALLVVALIAAAAGLGWLRAENLAAIGTGLLLIAAAAYFGVMYFAPSTTTQERARVAGYLPVFAGGVVYFALLFQIFTTASILVTERVDLSVGAWMFPSAWVVMSGTAASVLVAPLLARLWMRLGDDQPSPPAKFGIGLVVIGGGFLMLMAISIFYRDADIPLVPVLVAMCVIGSTETLVGPAGLSLASRIGPQAFASQMVGLNFLTLGLGSAASGVLGQLYSVMSAELFFALNAGLAVASGLALAAGRRRLNGLLQAGMAAPERRAA